MHRTVVLYHRKISRSPSLDDCAVPLARRGDLRCLNLIVERIPALMMFAFKYTVHADVIAVHQCRVAPNKDVYVAASVLQFERRVVVAPA